MLFLLRSALQKKFLLKLYRKIKHHAQAQTIQSIERVWPLHLRNSKGVGIWGLQEFFKKQKYNDPYSKAELNKTDFCQSQWLNIGYVI